MKGGKREGAGRPLLAGEFRKLRSIRATTEEWEMIREFSQILKKHPKEAQQMLEHLKKDIV